MAPSQRRAHVRSLGLGLLLCLGAADARAQTWKFRPVFTLGGGYDSNAIFTPGDRSPGDFFGGVGVRAPLTGKLSERSSLSANYAATGEIYQDLHDLDRFPSSQNASLGWSYTSQGSNASLGATYSESRRPEDVFPQSGLGFLRGRARNLGANAGVGHRLGERGTFDLAYAYSRPIYETADTFEQRAEGHSATANLGRSLSATSTVGVRYQYQLYLREDDPRDQSHVVGLALTRGFGRATRLSLFGGARFAGGETRPDGSISLSHAWRSSQLAATYTKSRSYIPTTGGFSDTDNAGLTYSLTPRRFRLSFSAGYARNHFEEETDVLGLGRDFDSYRGVLDTVYMLSRWLGLGATYQYIWQRSGNTDFDNRKRHLAQAGVVITPWNDKEVQGLR